MNALKPLQQIQDKERTEVYIYAEVDIDKAYQEIIQKGKRVKMFLADRALQQDFPQRIRKYKNFRICFDHEIQKFINRKQLSADLRLIKKSVFNALQEFVVSRFTLFIEQETLRSDYKNKVQEIELKFANRFQELARRNS